MLTIIQYPLYAVGSIYLLWVLYLAVMSLKRAHDAGIMSKVAYAFAWPIVGVGYVIDIAVNVTIGTALFADPPKLNHLTLSARLSDYWNDDPNDNNWRKRLAGWIAKNLLNDYDPSGQHIK